MFLFFSVNPSSANASPEQAGRAIINLPAQKFLYAPQPLRAGSALCLCFAMIV
jgi:hypothetical protein